MAKDLDIGFDSGYFEASPSMLAGGFADLATAAHDDEGADEEFRGSSLAAMDLEFEEDSLVRDLEDREDMQDLIELSLHMND